MIRNRLVQKVWILTLTLWLSSLAVSAAPQVGHAYTVMIPRNLIKMRISSSTGLTVGNVVLEATPSGMTVGGRRNWRTTGLPYALKMEVVVSKKKRIKLRKGALSVEILLKGKWSTADREKIWSEVLVEGYPDSGEVRRRLRRQITGYVASFSEGTDEERSKADVDLLLWFTVNTQARGATELPYKDSRILAVAISTGGEYYNSLQLNKRARVASVLSKRLLPLVRLSANAISDGRKRFMLRTLVSYKSFGQEMAPVESDQVALVVEPSLARSFADAEITDQAFLDRSIILVDSSRTEISLLVAN